MFRRFWGPLHIPPNSVSVPSPPGVSLGTQVAHHLLSTSHVLPLLVPLCPSPPGIWGPWGSHAQTTLWGAQAAPDQPPPPHLWQFSKEKPPRGSSSVCSILGWPEQSWDLGGRWLKEWDQQGQEKQRPVLCRAPSLMLPAFAFTST